MRNAFADEHFELEEDLLYDSGIADQR